MDLPNEEPYSVVEVFANGCVRARRSYVEETLNIYCIDPQYEQALP